MRLILHRVSKARTCPSNDGLESRGDLSCNFSHVPLGVLRLQRKRSDRRRTFRRPLVFLSSRSRSSFSYLLRLEGDFSICDNAAQLKVQRPGKRDDPQRRDPLGEIPLNQIQRSLQDSIRPHPTPPVPLPHPSSVSARQNPLCLPESYLKAKVQEWKCYSRALRVSYVCPSQQKTFMSTA